jgi:succinate dehydrogenase/fumarate reductase cytochrome b subunit
MADTILQQAWENAREVICHENELVSHRITGWLSIQGFLFAALFVCTTNFAADSSASSQICIAGFMLAVAYVGYVSTLRIYPAVRAAYRHVSATKLWWNKYLASTQSSADYHTRYPFPLIVGKRAKSLRWYFPVEETSDKDKAYDDCGFEKDDQATINDVMAAGIPKLITLFAWLWYWLLISFLAFGWLLFPSNFGNTGTSSTISIKEDSKSGDVSISYKGKIDQLPDLERRIGDLKKSNQPVEPSL